jgi:hypothetical protein
MERPRRAKGEDTGFFLARCDADFQGLSMSVNVLGAVADFFIALILVYYLRRSRTGFRK